MGTENMGETCMGLKASVMTANLVREVTAVSKAASTRSTLPILGNILIETTDGGLYLSATNLTSRLRAWVPAKVEEAGAITVDIPTLTHLLGQFDKASRTDLFLDGDKLLVGDGGQGTAGRLPTIAADEMPVLVDTSTWPVAAEILGAALSDRLSRAIPFCASDEARPILTGVNIQTAPGKVTFGAANNYVVTGLDAVSSPDGTETVKTVPATALKLLLGLLDAHDLDVVTYRVDEKGVGVSFRLEQYELTISAIDGQYPSYEQVIPVTGKDDSYGITVDRKAFLKALKLARKNDTVIHLLTTPETLMVAIPGEAGQPLYSKTFPATVTPAREEKIGFNPALLTLVLNNASGETVNLFRNSESVCSAFGVDTGDPSSRYAVMPVKLS